jgi:hypothetical protein
VVRASSRGDATSERQIRVHRSNAQRYTGDTSREGKAKSSVNSLAHGISATKPIAIARRNFAENQAAIVSVAAFGGCRSRPLFCLDERRSRSAPLRRERGFMPRCRAPRAER